MDPATMVGIGTMAGGLGSIAGGLGIGQDSSGGYKGREHKRSISNYWNKTMDMAGKYGVNKLTALGVRPTGSGFMRAGSGGGIDFAKMGRGLSKAMSSGMAYQEAKAISQGMALDNEYKKKRNEQMEMENLMMYRQMHQQPSIPGQQTSALEVTEQGLITKGKGAEYPPVIKAPQQKHAVEAGREGFYRYVNVPGGGVQVFPTQSMQEVTSEGFHAVEYAVKMAGKYIVDQGHNMFTNALIDGRNQLREMRPDAPSPSQEMRYDVHRRTWYPRSKEGKLFINPELWQFKIGREYKIKKRGKYRPSREERYGNESWYFD